VLDLMMPGRSGFDVVDMLAAEPATRDIPVVILTSKRMDEVERRRLAARVVTVVAKDNIKYALPEALQSAWGAAGERSVA
jgi:CheY-like chemotaxis protein